jgi:hypothetical protein
MFIAFVGIAAGLALFAFAFLAELGITRWPHP